MVAEARISIRPLAQHDRFFFHANYSSESFDPNDDFGLAIWNCASGAMPVLIADVDPLVVCPSDTGTGITLPDLVYAAVIPAGTCTNSGRSCSYRNPDVDAQNAGVRYFRVQYATRSFRNRVWLESYGDLTAATQANMLLVITINGKPRAVLEDTFTPLGDGGWFSDF